MKHTFDPYYAAIRYSEEHFPIQPLAPNFEVPEGASSNDPMLNHQRWSGSYKRHLIQLMTGTLSGVMALRINKPNAMNAADGLPALRRLVQRYEWNTNTPFFEDSRQRIYLYECHDEVIIDGVAEIAAGVELYGNGASIILPPYPCQQTNGLITWGGHLRLTRENLLVVPHSMVECAVHVLNVYERYSYHYRDAA